MTSITRNRGATTVMVYGIDPVPEAVLWSVPAAGLLATSDAEWAAVVDDAGRRCRCAGRWSSSDLDATVIAR